MHPATMYLQHENTNGWMAQILSERLWDIFHLCRAYQSNCMDRRTMGFHSCEGLRIQHPLAKDQIVLHS